jgi:hypothetical protein
LLEGQLGYNISTFKSIPEAYELNTHSAETNLQQNTQNADIENSNSVGQREGGMLSSRNQLTISDFQ